MRILIGLLSGILGMLAGWFALAILVIAVSGPDRDGGIAMGAFFGIGPIGGLIGFVAGILLFRRFGLSRRSAPSAPTPADAPAPAAAPSHMSRPFAISVLLLAILLAWWGWYEFVRSPYLSRGFMQLDMQFRLPPGMALPADGRGVQVEVTDGNQVSVPALGLGRDGDRTVITAGVSLIYKTRGRVARLTMPGVPTQSWRLGLPSDPDPTRAFAAWRPSDDAPATKVEMSYRLSAGN